MKLIHVKFKYKQDKTINHFAEGIFYCDTEAEAVTLFNELSNNPDYFDVEFI